MSKLKNILKEMNSIIAENENRASEFESSELVKFVLDKTKLELGLDYEVDEENEKKLIDFSKKRREGYPLQYILGSWQFFDLELEVGEGVLIPRGDTEDVCDAAFEYISEIIEPNVLDLCSGTGAIALAIKKYCPNSNVVAVEKYPEAYKYLLKNIEKNKLAVLPILGDVFNCDYIIDEETFDVIISNPPYIDEELDGKLQTEVSYEPKTALFAKDNGLRFYKFISHYYKAALKKGGYIVFEYGFDQAEKVKKVLMAEEYEIVKEIVDTGNNPRGIIAKKV